MSPNILQKYSTGNFHFPIKSGIDNILVNKDSILEVTQKIKEDEDLLYDQLIDITVTDNMLSKSSYSNERFTLIYSFLSLKFNKRLFIFTNISEDNLDINSITQIFESADWFERETYDMLGIEYTGHRDLRRILLPDDWEGWPLRKDYQVQETYHGIVVPKMKEGWE